MSTLSMQVTEKEKEIIESFRLYQYGMCSIKTLRDFMEATVDELTEARKGVTNA